MKKKIAIALCLSMALASFTACSGNSSKKDKNDKKNNKKVEDTIEDDDEDEKKSSSKKDKGDKDDIFGEEADTKSKAIGTTVTLGSFQGEDLNWIVLDEADGKYFVVAEKAVDSQYYTTGYGDVKWETCTVRSWLNEEFYVNAFTDAEKAKIQLTLVTDADSTDWVDTEDYLFLLSLNEAETLFADSDARICMMTDFALENNDITWVDDEGNLLGCWWWLRTNNKYKSAAVMIWENGNIYDYGSYPDVLMGVRPAMWIDAN